jgi:ABC-2 type transport system ATP-binding protein
VPVTAVSLQQISHTYPGRRGAAPREVLRGLALDIREGEIFGLLGPNGSGKTTLFKILSTLLAPTQGTASIFGADVRTQQKQARLSLGVVFQHPSLDGQLTVEENLKHQGRLYGVTGSDLSARVSAALKRVNLTDRKDDLVKTLSGGLQRRGEIAKALLHKPKLLLMDEPSTGLDPGARRDMWIALNELRGEGVTVLLTTHLMEEGERCDRLAILNLGQLVALGTPAELKSTIGGDVIIISTDEPDALAADVRKRFGADTKVVAGQVRVEKSAGHQFIPSLVEAFPGAIRAVTLGKPTLEDVFVQKTGHGFWQEDAE